MIGHYKFDIDLITKALMSMHGSGERHMGYIYYHHCQTVVETIVAVDLLFTASSGEMISDLDKKTNFVSNLLENKLQTKHNKLPLQQ